MRQRKQGAGDFAIPDDNPIQGVLYRGVGRPHRTGVDSFRHDVRNTSTGGVPVLPME